MTKNQIKNLIKNNFDFLLIEFNIYKIIDFKDYLLFELKSNKVVIRFTFTRRDCYLNVLFEKIIDGKVHPSFREAMGDLSDLFEDESFILQEFYLWEILEYKEKNIQMELILVLTNIISPQVDICKLHLQIWGMLDFHLIRLI